MKVGRVVNRWCSVSRGKHRYTRCGRCRQCAGCCACLKKYRVFVEDVGRAKFSAYYGDIEAASPLDAIFEATGVTRGSPVGKAWIAGTLRPAIDHQRLIALPHTRKDLWPDGKTGEVPVAALSYWYPR